MGKLILDNMKKKEVLGSMVQLKVIDLKRSGKFFRELGFESINGPIEGDVYLTDGTVRLALTTAEEPPLGLVYIVDDVDAILKSYPDANLEPSKTNKDLFISKSPAGVTFSILRGNGFKFEELSGNPIGLCGTYFELSIQTAEYPAECEFWRRLGMETIYSDDKANTWMTLADDCQKVGVFMEGIVSHPFRSPALTYFEKDMKDRIALVKELGMEFAYAEPSACGTGIRDAVLDSPAGYQIFLFSA